VSNLDPTSKESPTVRKGEKFSLHSEQRVPETGQVWGKLTIVEEVSSVEKGRHWLCRCNCGKKVIRTTSILRLSERRGSISSCPSCRSVKYPEQRKVDIGQIWGKLTVVEEEKTSTYRRKRWLCRCDCGNLVYRFSVELRKYEREGIVNCCRECRKRKNLRFIRYLRMKRFYDMYQDIGTLYCYDYEEVETRILLDESELEPRIQVQEGTKYRSVLDGGYGSVSDLTLDFYDDPSD
jgi:hypothetical protein